MTRLRLGPASHWLESVHRSRGLHKPGQAEAHPTGLCPLQPRGGLLPGECSFKDLCLLCALYTYNSGIQHAGRPHIASDGQGGGGVHEGHDLPGGGRSAHGLLLRLDGRPAGGHGRLPGADADATATIGEAPATPPGTRRECIRTAANQCLHNAVVSHHVLHLPAHVVRPARLGPGPYRGQ